MPSTEMDLSRLVFQIKRWGQTLGFQQVGISNTNLLEAEQHLHAWLDNNYQGEMDYIHKHGLKRSRPDMLLPGTRSIISVRMDYFPEPVSKTHENLDNPAKAFISRYALGRDYHKLLRHRLQALANKISEHIGSFGYRAFVDSAPVLEKAIAEKAGLGWIGKHSNVINRRAGSWFFLGELYTDLALPPDSPAKNHCGSCNACITVCPTQAIIAPYQVDARRCISYLTIELHGSIPEPFRRLIGNRIYGCDDCQIICPWNRFANLTAEADFNPRQQLNNQTLLEVFAWNEATFLRKTEGSAIRRIGYERWLRNCAVALGNAPTSAPIQKALHERLTDSSALVKEHVQWALQQQVPH